MLEGVGTHDALHHLAVGGQWHQYLVLVYHGGPVLVSQCVANLNGKAYGSLWVEVRQGMPQMRDRRR